MTSSERDVQVEERTNRILNDDRAVAAYARFVDAELRLRWGRRLLAGLRAAARVVAVTVVALLSVGLLLSLVPAPPPSGKTVPGGGR